jgi:class 3 adenylate cyclase
MMTESRMPGRPSEEGAKPWQPPHLPTGTLTFLFTDIEGSTRLARQLDDEWEGVLEAHRDTLRGVFAEHNGVEVGTEGDSFFVAFSRATDAIEAATQGQLALKAQPWPSGTEVRVRMGLHTGEVRETKDAGYTGLPIHEAARISSAAHGGQILLSQTVRDLLLDKVAVRGRLVDLGDHQLKDIESPVRIYELVDPHSPSQFPPIRSLRRVVETPTLLDTTAFDAHCRNVIRELAAGRVVPFLGAGANLVGRPEGGDFWEPGQCFPNTRQLTEYLALKFGYPEHSGRNLARVSQFVELTTGSGPLYAELHDVFAEDYSPTDVHEFLANLPRQLKAKGFAHPYQVIITTNYDDAMERAFYQVREEFDVVLYVADGPHRGKFLHRSFEGETTVIEVPNEYLGLPLDSSGGPTRTIIVKVHGAVNRTREDADEDSYVITEDHYIEYLANRATANAMPATLVARLIKSSFLFLGYSLEDWNLRVILRRIWGERHFSYRSWAVQQEPSLVEQEYWAKQDVEILRVALEEYIPALNERLSVLPDARQGHDPSVTR